MIISARGTQYGRMQEFSNTKETDDSTNDSEDLTGSNVSTGVLPVNQGRSAADFRVDNGNNEPMPDSIPLSVPGIALATIGQECKWFFSLA